MNEKIRKLLALGVVPCFLASSTPRATSRDIYLANATEIVERLPEEEMPSSVDFSTEPIVETPEEAVPPPMELEPEEEAPPPADPVEFEMPEDPPAFSLEEENEPEPMENPSRSEEETTEMIEVLPGKPEEAEGAPAPVRNEEPESIPSTEVQRVEGYSLGSVQAGSTFDLHIPVSFVRDGNTYNTHTDSRGTEMKPGLSPEAYSQHIGDTLPWMDVRLRSGAFTESGGPIHAQSVSQNPVSLVYGNLSVGYASFYGLAIPGAVEPGDYWLPLRVSWYDTATGTEESSTFSMSLEIVAANTPEPEEATLPTDANEGESVDATANPFDEILSETLQQEDGLPEINNSQQDPSIPEETPEALETPEPIETPELQETPEPTPSPTPTADPDAIPSPTPLVFYLLPKANEKVLSVEMDSITLPEELSLDETFDLPVTIHYEWTEPTGQAEEAPEDTPGEIPVEPSIETETEPTNESQQEDTEEVVLASAADAALQEDPLAETPGAHEAAEEQNTEPNEAEPSAPDTPEPKVLVVQMPNEPPPALIEEGARLTLTADSLEGLPIDPLTIPESVPLSIDEETQTATAVLTGLKLKTPVIDADAHLSPEEEAANRAK